MQIKRELSFLYVLGPDGCKKAGAKNLCKKLKKMQTNQALFKGPL